MLAYPWFAPAGTRRGGITNATAVGYIDALSGEFQTVALNEGQRDTLYDLKVNPIPFLQRCWTSCTTVKRLVQEMLQH
jgi:hypothetical protein